MKIGTNAFLGCVKIVEKSKAKEKWIYQKRANVTCNWQVFKGTLLRDPGLNRKIEALFCA